MKTSEAFPSDYLKASDLNGRAVVVTIANVELVELGKDRDKETKLLITFVGKQRGLICNKTNSRTIEKVLGSDDTDDWIGHKIIIEPREVEFGSDMVWAIRVSLKNPELPQAAPKPRPPQPPQRSMGENAEQGQGGPVDEMPDVPF